MSISFYKAGDYERHARAIGISLALGRLGVDDVDETRKQLNLSIGFWWWICHWQIWREQ